MAMESTRLVDSADGSTAQEPPKPGRKVLAPMILVGLSAAMVLAARATSRGGVRLGSIAGALSEVTDPTLLELDVSNAYERSLGIPIGDGIYSFKHLVEMYQETTLTLKRADGGEIDGSMKSFTWDVDEDADDGDVLSGVSVAHTFTKLGEHQVRIHAYDSASSSSTMVLFTVTSKYVRRELRDLTDEDRARYFAALRTLYFTSQEAGEKIYGSGFMSADWLVREHLEGAADKECDHWHDDAGFITHHIGITIQMEKSLRMVDPHVCSHYWDYTVDATADYPWYKSPIFDDQWFGGIPNTTHHAVVGGLFGNTPVLQDASSFSNITNPYGLLRSPWNTNKVPYLLRGDHVVGVESAYYTLPKCDEFSAYLSTDDGGSLWIGEVFNALNGILHGPVHIMTGGHFGFDPETMKAFHNASEHASTSPDQVLLASKFLWRQGYVRCPAKCSSDTPQEECMCSCPATLMGGRSAYDILHNFSGVSTIDTIFGEDWHRYGGMSYDALWDTLCSVGHPGEMFSSAAPQDPLFWPLHGLAERFVQLMQHYNSNGDIVLDQTWGYDHSQVVLSDTHLVCDWDDVGEMELPSCSFGKTCTGHRADDFLPFKDLIEGSGKSYYTNEELYQLINPWSADLPYVYDKLTTWPGCENGTLSV